MTFSLCLCAQWGTGMRNISRDAHIPHANGMRAAVFVGHLFQMQTALEHTLALSCLGCRVPISTRLRLTTRRCSRKRCSLARIPLFRSPSVLELKAFCCRVPKPKDSFPPRRRRRWRRRRWRREMTPPPPPAKYSLISASIFRERGREGETATCEWSDCLE